jgi:4-hydroxybenzoate polyprenyltransferase
MSHPTPQRPPTVHDPSEAATSSSRARSPLAVRAVDIFAFSSGLAAAIGGTLCLVASRLLDAPDAGSWAFLAASGTFIIYNLDRLRDIDRDRASSPLRTAFVARNRQRLYASVGLVAIGFVVTLQAAPPSIILLCLAIGLLGLFHRRLKEVPALKVAYVSFAWVAACVGMPWIVSGRKETGLWIAGILLASLAANLIASNLRDQAGEVEGKTAHSDTTAVLWIARAIAVLGIGITLAAPNSLHPLIWIPATEGLTLAFFRHTERYSQIAVDGALLIGAFAASLHLRTAAGIG